MIEWWWWMDEVGGGYEWQDAARRVAVTHQWTTGYRCLNCWVLCSTFVYFGTMWPYCFPCRAHWRYDGPSVRPSVQVDSLTHLWRCSGFIKGDLYQLCLMHLCVCLFVCVCASACSASNLLAVTAMEGMIRMFVEGNQASRGTFFFCFHQGILCCNRISSGIAENAKGRNGSNNTNNIHTTTTTIIPILNMFMMNTCFII